MPFGNFMHENEIIFSIANSGYIGFVFSSFGDHGSKLRIYFYFLIRFSKTIEFDLSVIETHPSNIAL
jgi:hypothetical protein